MRPCSWSCDATGTRYHPTCCDAISIPQADVSASAALPPLPAARASGHSSEKQPSDKPSRRPRHCPLVIYSSLCQLPPLPPRWTPRRSARGTCCRVTARAAARGVTSRVARHAARAACWDKNLVIAPRAAHLSSVRQCTYCARDCASLARLPARAPTITRIQDATAIANRSRD